MAYAELLGLDGGASSAGTPACDAGISEGAPSTQCACVSLVVPDSTSESYLIDVLLGQLPTGCAGNLDMPIDSDGGWAKLDSCSLQLVEQWVEYGANP